MFERLKEWLFVDSNNWYGRLSLLLVVLTLIVGVSHSGTQSSSDSGAQSSSDSGTQLAPDSRRQSVPTCHSGNRWGRLACGYMNLFMPNRDNRSTHFRPTINNRLLLSPNSTLISINRTPFAKRTLIRNKALGLLESKNLTPTVSLP